MKCEGMFLAGSSVSPSGPYPYHLAIYCLFRLWSLYPTICSTAYFVCRLASLVTASVVRLFSWRGVSPIVRDELLWWVGSGPYVSILFSSPKVDATLCIDTVLCLLSLSITTVCHCTWLIRRGTDLRGWNFLLPAVAIPSARSLPLVSDSLSANI